MMNEFRMTLGRFVNNGNQDMLKIICKNSSPMFIVKDVWSVLKLASGKLAMWSPSLTEFNIFPRREIYHNSRGSTRDAEVSSLAVRGLSVILTGDFSQLPPVTSRLLYGTQAWHMNGWKRHRPWYISNVTHQHLRVQDNTMHFLLPHQRFKVVTHKAIANPQRRIPLHA